jgi:type II secretory ATPase GspE/PulE/Tfp pilus assembly ATPase PilB-like protein
LSGSPTTVFIVRLSDRKSKYPGDKKYGGNSETVTAEIFMVSRHFVDLPMCPDRRLDMGRTKLITKAGLIDPNKWQIQPEVLKLIPETMARKFNAIPLELVDSVLRVAMSEVDNIRALQEMAAVAKLRIEPIPAGKEEIRVAIDNSYKAYKEIEKQIDTIVDTTDVPKERVDIDDVSDAPIVKALDMIVSEAAKVHASDIHIEPQEDAVRVRYRIDGVLYDTMTLPTNVHDRLISRIKVLSSMDIADRRAQDGQFSVKVRNRDIDIRVATIETIYGEMGSLRILDKSFAALELSQLGFLPESLELFKRMLKSPLGMILVSGPTGSGKTTTLYASINSLDRVGRKVITVEDPVEYRFNNINQIQVNIKSGLTFATGLRSILRHDPDVVLIGEIRDGETAEIGTQAALIGQLVLSSVHANDTVGAFLRLMDLGITPFLISATLVGVITQRMVRRVCPHCKQLMKAPPEAREAYFCEIGEDKAEFFYGKGCNLCANTGYLGRLAVFEIMVMNQELRAALISHASADQLRELARKSGMVTMWRDGMLKVKNNITTPSEVLRNIFRLE